MEAKDKFPLLLSSFWLKIIALLTMTIDHIGYAFDIEPLRYIGRLSLPLFCFMIAEGAIHTKNFKKYSLRLGIMALFISVVILLFEEVPYFYNQGLSMRSEGNIFIDLLLGAVAVFLLTRKQWYFKLLVILPVAYGVTSYIARTYECVGCGHIVHWFPYFIRTQYGWFGITLIIGFYLAHLLTELFIKQRSSMTGIDKEVYKGTYFERVALNVISVVVLAVIATLNFVCDYLMGTNFAVTVADYNMQIYCILSGAFILLYNGKRGYNKKWFQYGSYLYYPLHLLVIGLLQMLI